MKFHPPSTIPDVSSPQYWSARYRSGDTPWDLGGETPALAALLDRIDFPRPTEFYQPRVLVPGCGYGHDALMLAQRGYRVTAVDFAPEPIEYLRQTARLAEVKLEALCCDIFDLPTLRGSVFDIVLEYTCYCAIDPKRRSEYATTLAQLIVPNGIVAGLFFPLDDLPRSEPPFTVREEEVRHQFEAAGFVLVDSWIPLESHPARAGRERLMLFRKLL
ncbi:MAG: methyltransferase domain-containing protein [Bacteroidota bacterium]|nr:TPMT family class I SAM-dependent methyltransferase [Candidatus Kapabacteria bacterium]MCS7302546.1 TPMT family class I SAM-dependent methyltransferase [Candidatus Kapabacteria bacterium]MCX7936768.1 TPMT family class I SAM-dependent methyltransferase [Chlorobiota bacterium]MDW8074188.1 methyltransferase domain-containing protein [Bacteroidota bacterium]MDW8271336.1 methyltransferase domain-containing protein [Bacteroidota bacterium]